MTKDLYLLIKKMSKKEKINFKRSLGNSKEDTLYLKLYETINNQKTFSENEIIAAGIPKNKIRQIKYNLLKKINESLINEYLECYGELGNLYKLSILHKIYQDKGLDYEIEIINKLKKISIKNDNYDFLLHALLHEIRWHRNKKDIKSVEKTSEQIKKCINDLFNLHTYIDYNTTFMRDFIRYGYRTNEVSNTVLNLRMYHDKNPPVLAEAKWMYMQTLINDAMFRNRFSEAKTHITETISMLEKTKYKFHYYELYYSFTLNTLTICLLRLNKIDEAINTIEKHKKIIFHTKAAKLHAFTYSLINEAYLYKLTKNYEQGIKKLADSEEKLKKIENDISETDLLVMYFNVAYLHFQVKNYKKSKHYLNKIFSLPHTLRLDIQVSARIIYMILLFDTNDVYSYEYFINNTFKYIKKNTPFYKIEIMISGTLRKLFRKKLHEKNFTEDILKFKDKISNLFESDPQQKEFLNYFDILSWINEKISST